MKWIKNKAHFSFLLPYILVFLVPFICLSLILHHYFITNAQNQIEQYEDSSLQQIESNLFDSLTRLNQMSSNVGTNPKLTRFYVTQRAVLNETSELLKRYASLNSVIDEMILYYPTDKDYFYSSQGFYSKEAFRHHKLKVNETDFTTFQTLFDSDTTGLYAINNSGTTNLMFISNIDAGRSNGGKIIFLLNQTNFIKQFANNYPHGFALYNAEQQLIYQSKSLSDDTLARLNQHHSTDNYHTLTEEDDYIIGFEQIGQPFHIYALINKSQLHRPLNSLKAVYYSGIIILCLVGLMISYYFSNRQYRPMKRLSEKMQKVAPPIQASDQEENIYHALQSNIDYIIEHQSLLSTQLSHQKSQYIHSLYKYLLEGHQLDQTDMQLLTANLMSFEKNSYFTALLKADLIEEQLDELFPMHSDNFEAFLVNETFVKSYQLIFAHFDATHYSTQQVAEQIFSLLTSKSQLPLQLLIGRAGTDLTTYYPSYLDTLYLYEQAEQSQQTTIIYFDEDSTTQQTDLNYIFSTNFIKLRNSVEHGNIDVCTQTIHEIIEIAKLPSTNQIMSKSLLYEIFNCLMKYAVENHITIADNYYEQLSTNFNPFSSENILIAFGEYVCEQMQIKLADNNNLKNNEIISHILANYRNIDFSIEQLSDDLKLSVNAINQVLKEKVGVTFSKYVQQLRFNYVKEQLVTTDETIKNIIANSGYLDASNFTRQFRTIFGCTPGQYRTNYKQNKL